MKKLTSIALIVIMFIPACFAQLNKPGAPIVKTLNGIV